MSAGPPWKLSVTEFLHASRCTVRRDFVIVPWVPLKICIFLTVLSSSAEAAFCGDSSVLWIVQGNGNPATWLLYLVSLLVLLQNLCHFCKKQDDTPSVLNESLKSFEWNYKYEKCCCRYSSSRFVSVARWPNSCLVQLHWRDTKIDFGLFCPGKGHLRGGCNYNSVFSLYLNQEYPGVIQLQHRTVPKICQSLCYPCILNSTIVRWS